MSFLLGLVESVQPGTWIRVFRARQGRGGEREESTRGLAEVLVDGSKPTQRLYIGSHAHPFFNKHSPQASSVPDPVLGPRNKTGNVA
jgi:hypothetical protein